MRKRTARTAATEPEWFIGSQLRGDTPDDWALSIGLQAAAGRILDAACLPSSWATPSELHQLVKFACEFADALVKAGLDSARAVGVVKPQWTAEGVYEGRWGTKDGIAVVIPLAFAVVHFFHVFELNQSVRDAELEAVSQFVAALFGTAQEESPV